MCRSGARKGVHCIILNGTESEDRRGLAGSLVQPASRRAPRRRRPFFNSRREKLVALAARLPFRSNLRVARVRRARGLIPMADEPSRALAPKSGSDLCRRSSRAPADVCRSQHDNLELVGISRPPNALGLTVPPSIRARAARSLVRPPTRASGRGRCKLAGGGRVPRAACCFGVPARRRTNSGARPAEGNGAPAAAPVQQSTCRAGCCWLSTRTLSAGALTELVDRYSEAMWNRLPDLAGDCRRQLDVVVACQRWLGEGDAGGDPAPPTRHGPLGVEYPVADGSIASMAHPVGRVTCLALQTFEVRYVKRLTGFCRTRSRRPSVSGAWGPPGKSARAAELLSDRPAVSPSS